MDGGRQEGTLLVILSDTDRHFHYHINRRALACLSVRTRVGAWLFGSKVISLFTKLLCRDKIRQKGEVPVVTKRPSLFYTTPQLMELTGLTRGQVQRLEEAGALVPLRRGKQGRGFCAMWSFEQAIGTAYYLAFLDAGCHATWGYGACDWVSRQPSGALQSQLEGKKRILLALSPNGDGQLIEPHLPPGASREQLLKVDKLNLVTLYDRIKRRADELAARLVKEKAKEGD
jgi:hypothetical protein